MKNLQLSEKQLKRAWSYINDYAFEEMNKYKYLRDDFNSNRVECINYMIYNYFRDFIYQEFYLDFIENNPDSIELGKALVLLQLLNQNHKVLVAFIKHLVPDFNDFMEENFASVPNYFDLSQVKDGFLPCIEPGNCLRNNKLLYKIVYPNQTIIYGDNEYELYLKYQDNKVIKRAYERLMDYFEFNEELAKEVKEGLK